MFDVESGWSKWSTSQMLFLLILFLHLGIKTEYDCGQIRRGVGVSINKTSIVSYKRNIISHKHGKSREEKMRKVTTCWLLKQAILEFIFTSFQNGLIFLTISFAHCHLLFFVCNCVPLFEAKGECSKWNTFHVLLLAFVVFWPLVSRDEHTHTQKSMGGRAV